VSSHDGAVSSSLIHTRWNIAKHTANTDTSIILSCYKMLEWSHSGTGLCGLSCLSAVTVDVSSANCLWCWLVLFMGFF